MKELFLKANRIGDNLSAKGHKERRVYLILSVVLFVLSALSMWEFIFEFCNMIGSLTCSTPIQAGRELVRMFPLMLTAWTYTYMGIWLHNAYRAHSEEKRCKKIFGNGIATIVLGAIIALYVVVGYCTGEYAKFVEGYISFLFPVDILLGGLLIVSYGVSSILYSKKIKVTPSDITTYNDTRNKHLRRFDHFFYGLSYVISLFAFAGCAYGLFEIDSTHGGVFFNIMLWLNYFVAFAMVVVYKFFYVELKDEFKPKAQFITSIFFVVLNVVLLGLYLLSVQIFNEAPNLNAFAVLPIEFTASFNVFPIIYGLNNIAAPLAALIKSLVSRAKEKKLAK